MEDRSLFDDPGQLRQRTEMLERLESYDLPGTPAAPLAESLPAELCSHAKAMQAKLEAANAAVYASIRNDIREGRGRDSLLRHMPESEVLGKATSDFAGYDFLDELLTGILQFQELDATGAALAAEMVFYQPTPARHIFDLLARTAPTKEDVLVDIGSGLGHVALLTRIWTEAHSIGIEIEPAYVECAKQAAESLNLEGVTFLQEDARCADYSSGTLFYLYTPFTGGMLRATLEKLRAQAAMRPIRVGAYGPCVRVLAAQAWLEPMGEVQRDRISIWRARAASLFL